MTTREELAVQVLSRFTSTELLALADRRADAERRHGDQVAAGLADTFWTEIESDPDTVAAFERLTAEIDRSRSRPEVLSSLRTSRRAGKDPAAYGRAAL